MSHQENPAPKSKTSHIAVPYTLFESDRAPLSKQFALKNGELIKSASGVLSSGAATIRTTSGTADFVNVLKNCSSHQAIALGVMRDACAGEMRKIVSEKDMAKNPDAITRSLSNFCFPINDYGLMLLDYDSAGAPDHIKAEISEPDGFAKIVTKALPLLARTAYVSRGSTSTGLYNAATGEYFPDSSGQHLYVFVYSAEDIPRVLEILYKRLWLLGYGWCTISAGGAILERAVVDASVGSPERLVYVGAPVLEAPLAQDASAREPVAHPGAPLNSEGDGVPNLSDAEEAAYKALVADARRAIEPEARRIRDEIAAKRMAQIIRSGVDPKVARMQFDARYSDTLGADVLLEFDDPKIGACTVADVLADPLRFNGKTLADPIEGVGYGRCKAKVFFNEGSTIINSFAHGGGLFRLLDIQSMFDDLGDPREGAAGATEKAAGDFEGLGEGQEAENAQAANSGDWKGRGEEPIDPWAEWELPEFPADAFPAPIRKFIETHARVIGCDLAGMALSVLAAFSFAIDHRIELRLMRTGRFKACARLWIAIVAGPSSKKSPMQEAALHFLTEYERELIKANAAFPENEPEDGDEEGDEDEDAPEPPPPMRLLTQDPTPEAMGVILSREKQARGLGLHRDEIGGWIGGMDRYAGGKGGGERGFWLQCYDGGPYTIDRVGRGMIHIPHLSVSVFGAIQPDKLLEFGGLTNDGFLQRFLVCMSLSSKFTTETLTEGVDDDMQRLLSECIQLKGIDESTKKNVELVMTDEAMEAFTNLRRELHEMQEYTDTISKPLPAFIGKLAGKSGSIALILHLMENPTANVSKPVQVQTIHNTARLVKEVLIPHAVAFYRMLADQDPHGDATKSLASWILTSGVKRFTPAEAKRNVAALRRISDPLKLADQINLLVTYGWIRSEDKNLPPRGTKAWLVNPGIREFFADRMAQEERRKADVAWLMNSPRKTRQR